MSKKTLPATSEFKEGDRVILPTGETGRISHRPNPHGWITIRDRDQKRFYYRDEILKEVF